MKYIFLFKRTPDIDHLLPISYALINKSKINNKNIFFINYSPDITLLNYKCDKRIAYLNYLGINIIIPKIINLYFFNLILKNKYKNKFLKFSLVLLIKILDKIIKKYYSRIFNYIKFNFKNYKIITPTANYEFLYKLKADFKDQNINIYGVHIGLPLRYLNKNEKNEYEKYFKLLDFYLFPSKTEISNNNIFLKNYDKLIDICPSRFDAQWLNILSNDVYKIKNRKSKKKNIKLLFFLEKFVSSSFEYNSKVKNIENKTIKILKILKQINNLQVIIKAHPSMFPNRKNFIYLNQYSEQIYYDDKITSFELIKMCDIVVGINTSALIDAFLLNKKIIILNFLRRYYKQNRNKLIFDNLSGKYIVNSSLDFIDVLNNYINNQDFSFEKYNKEFINFVLKDFYNNPMKIISSKIVNT